jgi:hypothetical protein
MPKAPPHFMAAQGAPLATVHCPKDAGLSALLRGSGGNAERLVNELAQAADPEHATSAVYLGDTAGVIEDLTALLVRARTAGNPAAEGIAGILSQLGAAVPEPQPAAGPAPASAPRQPPLPPARP